MNRSIAALTVERPQAAPWSAPARPLRLSRALELAGVIVRADLSCGFGAALTAWTIAAAILPETNPGSTATAYWVAGGAGALLLVASLAAHEVGHAIAARRAGFGVARITLSFGGGSTDIVGAIRHPAHELLIAVAGPAASLLAAFAAAIAHVILVESDHGVAATVAALLAVANLAFVALNLVPGLPLDGGHALRALMWVMTGRPDAALHLAMSIGRRLGTAFVALAVIGSAFGFVAIALWAALLGLVLRES